MYTFKKHIHKHNVNIFEQQANDNDVEEDDEHECELGRLEKKHQKLVKKYKNIQSLYNEKKLQMLYLKFQNSENRRDYDFLNKLIFIQGVSLEA